VVVFANFRFLIFDFGWEKMESRKGTGEIDFEAGFFTGREAVGGAAGNAVYGRATEAIQREVSTGTSLTSAMRGTGVFPPMVLQMSGIGEESGSLEHMLAKAAEIYEDEVDEMVKGLSSLMEPFIIVFLGTLIGGTVVSMYLPIFELGSVV
jgi:type IV pilus assembly protein PilC